MLNIQKPTKKTFVYAKQIIIDGKVVAFPTETVYGLGANALNQNAVEKIFKLKKRPSDNPLIVHVGFKKDISKYAIISNNIEKKIINKLMPGPLTLILKKRKNIPNNVSSNNFVGIRIPGNKIALKLLKICKLPISAPSANLSGLPSPTSANMVYDYFNNKIKLIIDGGDCVVGIESTVVKINKKKSGGKFHYQIDILRPGFITKEDIELLFENKKNINISYSNEKSNLSPGIRYKHYSPKADIKIISKLKESTIKLNLNNKKIGLIASDEFIQENKILIKKYKNKLNIFSRGSRSNLISCSQNLFKLYNACDKLNINIILIEQLKEIGLGYSIMNRIKKSASKK